MELCTPKLCKISSSPNFVCLVKVVHCYQRYCALWQAQASLLFPLAKELSLRSKRNLVHCTTCVSTQSNWPVCLARKSNKFVYVCVCVCVSLYFPAGFELLYQPEVVRLYLSLLTESQNYNTLEAAAGALQNLSAGQWTVSPGSGGGGVHYADTMLCLNYRFLYLYIALYATWPSSSRYLELCLYLNWVWWAKKVTRPACWGFWSRCVKV